MDLRLQPPGVACSKAQETLRNKNSLGDEIANVKLPEFAEIT